ncbi:MAG: T9SS type A sorting domain-containing protein [Bacteroidia bacterium]|nr:T9SS type A sorting domain-containing protein [Bacteroidia bacterium]
MKKYFFLILVLLFSVKTNLILAQCLLDVGNDTSIVCGESFQLNADSKWKFLNSNSNKNFSSVHFLNSNIGYIVGDSGTIIKTINAGASFFELPYLTTEHLTDVFFINDQIGFIVGNNGLILKTINAGSTWSIQTSGTTWNLFTIFFVSDSIGYIAGDFGTILKTTNAGVSWIKQTVNASTYIRSIYFLNADTGYAVGYNANGGILKTNDGGNTWTVIYNQSNINFFSVWFTSTDTGYVSGMGAIGFILKTVNGGVSWTTLLNLPSLYISTFYFTDKNIGYAVGGAASGQLYKTTNAGNTWVSILQGSSTLRLFKNICFINNDTGYLVGYDAQIYKYIAPKSCVWTSNVGINQQNISNLKVTPFETTTYTLTALVDSCIVTDSLTINVTPLTVNAGIDKMISCGDSVQLEITTNANSSVKLSYKWTPNIGLNYDSIANPIAKPNSNITYFITVTSPNGCTAIDTINVSINLAISAGFDQIITCSKFAKLTVEPKWIRLINASNNYEYDIYRSVCFLNADTGFVAGNRKMYKTTNGGISWTEIQLQSNVNSIRSFYFVNNNVGFAGGFSDLQMNGVILKTIDGGNNWTATIVGLTNSGTAVYSVCFPTASIGYAVCSGGKIYKTINGGNSWSAQTSGTTLLLNKVFFINALIGYAYGQQGTILKTINGGTTWTSLTPFTTQELIDVKFTSIDTAYLITALGKLYKSVDSGSNWLLQNSNIYASSNQNFYFRSIHFMNQNTGYAAGFYNKNSDVKFYGCIFKTENGGITWTRQNADSMNEFQSIYFPKTNIGYIIGINGTILKLPIMPTSYTWFPTTGLLNHNAQNTIATPILSTNYVVTGFYSNCTVSDTVKVLVNPIKLLTNKELTAVCGDSAKLEISNLFIDIQATPYNSNWIIIDSNNNIVISSIPNKATNAYYKLPNGNYKFKFFPKNMPTVLYVRIFPFLQDSISEMLPLTMDTSVRYFTINNEDKFTFTQSQAQIISPTLNSYQQYVSVTSTEGCYSVDSINIVGMPIKASAGFDKNFVCGASAILDTVKSNYTGAGKLSYKWIPNIGLNNDSIYNPTTSVITHSTYYVTITSQNGCLAKDTVNVIVDSLTVSGLDKFVKCGDSAKLFISTNYNGKDKLSYLWTPSTGLDSNNIANPIVKNFINQKYNITVSSVNGCIAKNDVNVFQNPLDSIDICMVGVDGTNKNMIVWNKPITNAIDSFYIFKETNITNIYSRIGKLNYSSFSTFSDTNSYPDVQSNKYKIAIKDNCGFQSSASIAHKTMHLTINKGTGTTWNLIWNAYEGFVVSTYNVYRGTSPNNLVQIGTSSGSNTQYSDLIAPDGFIYYQVEIVSPRLCSPSKSYNSSRSNIATNKPIGINESFYENNLFSIYPNPFTENLTIDVPNIKNIGILSIYSLQGQLLFEKELKYEITEMDLSYFASGIYVICIKLNNDIAYKKFIKQ